MAPSMHALHSHCQQWCSVDENNLRGFEQQWLQIASAVSLAAAAPALVAVVGAA